MSRRSNETPAFRMSLIAALGEGLLAAIAAIWIWSRDLTLYWGDPWYGMVLGVLATVPLLVLNLTVFFSPVARWGPFKQCAAFRDEFVLPLSALLGPAGAVAVAITSGFAEELLFRGAIEGELRGFVTETGAALVSAAIFAYPHVAANTRRFPFVLALYFLLGLYFSALARSAGGLISAMIGHGLYNFCALIYMQKYHPPDRRISREFSDGDH